MFSDPFWARKTMQRRKAMAFRFETGGREGTYTVSSKTDSTRSFGWVYYCVFIENLNSLIANKIPVLEAKFPVWTDRRGFAFPLFTILEPDLWRDANMRSAVLGLLRNTTAQLNVNPDMPKLLARMIAESIDKPRELNLRFGRRLIGGLISSTPLLDADCENLMIKGMVSWSGAAPVEKMIFFIKKLGGDERPSYTRNKELWNIKLAELVSQHLKDLEICSSKLFASQFAGIRIHLMEVAEWNSRVNDAARRLKKIPPSRRNDPRIAKIFFYIDGLCE